MAKSQGLSLCDFCDRQNNDCTQVAPDRSPEGCGDLTPALFFQDPAGLEGVFSTFRASAVWYDRAKVLYGTHRTVALVQTGGLVRIGRARLVDAHRGPFWALMERHSHTNHLNLADGTPRELAQERLEKWIRTFMGSRFVKERDAIGTVLYLERLP